MTTWDVDRGLRTWAKAYTASASEVVAVGLRLDGVVSGWHEPQGGLSPDGSETFLLCSSAAGCEKERVMHVRFAKQIEESLGSFERRIERSRRWLARGCLQCQIGRLLGRNSRAAGRYAIRFEVSATRPSGL